MNIFKNIFENHLHSLFGKGTKTAKGYVRLKKKPYRDKYRARVVYEKHYGPLPPGYDVHHKNAINNDDRPENLSRVQHERHPLVTFKGKAR
jgi:hypothetical protein